MLSVLRSLRFRLVLLFVVIFSLMQIPLSIAALMVGESHLRNHFNLELLQRSESMAAELVKSQQKLFAPGVAEVVRNQALSVIFRGFFVQLHDGQGQLLQRSDNLGDYRLPIEVGPKNSAGPGQTRLDTLEGPEIENLLGAHQRLRMVTRLVNEPKQPPLYLQVAASLQQVDASIRQLRYLLILGMPVGLMAAAVASWIVIDRAVRKILAVSQLAQRVQPGQLGQRLETSERSDEIGHMVRQINAMLERLEAGFAAQDNFIYDASHELKTPLSILLSEAQVLKMVKPTTEQCLRFIDSVEQETRHLAILVDSMLTLARRESEKPMAAREVGLVNQAVESAVEACQSLAQQRGVRVTLLLAESSEEQGDLMFRGDGSLVTVMVSNLVRNAISFSPPDQEVVIEVHRDTAQALIEVRDHGPGVPPKVADKIFDRFIQAGGESWRRGAGLGLAIARAIARLHGGDIKLTNLKGGGCVFIASIALITEDAAPH